MKVVKFGGSSVANAEQISKIIDVVTADADRRIVEISYASRAAMADTLLSERDIDRLSELVDTLLPAEVGERLFDLAAGGSHHVTSREVGGLSGGWRRPAFDVSNPSLSAPIVYPGERDGPRRFYSALEFWCHTAHVLRFLHRVAWQAPASPSVWPLHSTGTGRRNERVPRAIFA